jgi:hypothetical protein
VRKWKAGLRSEVTRTYGTRLVPSAVDIDSTCFESVGDILTPVEVPMRDRERLKSIWH